MGLLETAIRQARRLVRTRSARENGGKYLLLAATAADAGTTADRALSHCRSGFVIGNFKRRGRLAPRAHRLGEACDAFGLKSDGVGRWTLDVEGIENGGMN